MKETSSIQEKPLIFGTITGAALSLFILIKYFTGTYFITSFIDILEIAIPIVCLRISIKKYPFTVKPPSWLDMTMLGVRVMFFSAILTSFVIYLLCTFDSVFMKTYIDTLISSMASFEDILGQTGVSEEDFDNITPLTLFLSHVMQYVLSGFFMSMLVAAYCSLSARICYKQ